MSFNNFKQAVAKQFAVMSKHHLFRTNVSGDEMWETYLASFPKGTNPIYRERTEHDCSCCKQFIRNIGNVVAIINGEAVSIWDVELPAIRGYKDVAAAMKAKALSKPIIDFYLHHESIVGTDKNFETIMGEAKAWEHFHVRLPNSVVMSKGSIASVLGQRRTMFEVTKRGLIEISYEALDTVLELINQNSLYRGAEFKDSVQKFKKLKQDYAGKGDNFIWQTVAVSGGVGMLRNSVIGTLLVDLSDGVMDMERAVASFEAKVAPTNYKRPTAVVTPRMVADAKKKIEDLGLTSALERRYATIDDITINNVLFANRDTKATLGGKDVFDELSGSVTTNPKSFDKVEEITIDKFLSDVLPSAKSVQVLVENRHSGNLMSLIAPVDPTAPSLFKWGNNFSWSYTGDVTDSIKERVKAAGGSVTGDLCCRLAWNNRDDLDLYMDEPGNHRIYFSVRRQLSVNGGMLDLDANGADGQRNDPAENIFYSSMNKMREGIYKLSVHQYNARSTQNPGFEIEIDALGEVHHFAYEKAVRQGERIHIADIVYSRKNGFKIEGHLPSTTSSKDIWGLKTQTFADVKAIMLSPNHWDDQGVGNRHWFFMLDGCANDGTARGIYNEFLNTQLEPHRKVMEMVGNKLKTDKSDQQLSGLGFSSTMKNSVICRINGTFSRVVRVTF